MRIILLVLLLAHVASAETKYIPYVSQGPGWSTAFHVHNLCEEPSSYEVAFKDSDGGPIEFSAYDRMWTGFYYQDIAPKGAEYVYFPPEGSTRHGYAEVVNDGDGCVATDVFYVKHLPDGRGWYAKGNPKPLSAPGVALPFLYDKSCDSRMVVFGAGKDVTLEAVGLRGNVLGRARLKNVFQQSFMLTEKIPGTDGEYGTLRVYGKATALGLLMCDYPEPGEPKQLYGALSTHPIPGGPPSSGDDEDDPPGEGDALPSDETYVIEAFATKLLAQESYGDHGAGRVFLQIYS